MKHTDKKTRKIYNSLPCQSGGALSVSFDLTHQASSLTRSASRPPKFYPSINFVTIYKLFQEVNSVKKQFARFLPEQFHPYTWFQSQSYMTSQNGENNISSATINRK